MPTIPELMQQLTEALSMRYDLAEARAITRIAAEETFGRQAVRLGETFTEQNPAWEQLSAQLRTGMPLQYALGKAWFMDLELQVSPAVLIPRPETEELVAFALRAMSNMAETAPFRIIDIGTGSGCIAISLKKAMPQIEILALDISDDSLAIARENAATYQCDITFIKGDILQPEILSNLGTFDIIISNPPYIAPSESADIHSNVVDFEPALALFAQEEDPLIFYKSIAAFGNKQLKPGGAIFCEISSLRSTETQAVFTNAGYTQVSITADMQGLPRIVSATRKN